MEFDNIIGGRCNAFREKKEEVPLCRRVQRYDMFLAFQEQDMPVDEYEEVVRHLSECYFCHEYFQLKQKEETEIKSEIRKYIEQIQVPPWIQAKQRFFASVYKCGILKLLANGVTFYADLLEKSTKVVQRIAMRGSEGIEAIFPRAKTVNDLARQGHVVIEVDGVSVIPDVIPNLHDICSTYIVSGKVEITDAGLQWLKGWSQEITRKLYDIDQIVDSVLWNTG